MAISEFHYYLVSPNNHIGRPPVFSNVAGAQAPTYNFASVYAIRKADAEAIHQAGTAAGFKGIVWSNRLWLDFDNMEAAERAERSLKETDYDFRVYDTGGGRGRHIGILRHAAPSHLLPLQDKAYAAASFPGCDLSLYWHLHLLRLPGAIHERTGKPKTLLYHREGKALVLPPYVPTEVVMPEVRQENSVRPSIFSVWGVISNLAPLASEGDRHAQLVRLAKALQADANVTPEEALWVTMEVNRGFTLPKDEHEVEEIVKWAYRL